MDGIHKNDFGWAAIILVVSLLCFSLCFLSGCWVTNKKWKNRIEQTESTVRELEMQRDSLMRKNEELDKRVVVLIDSLKTKKEKIVYIKIKGNEKIDSIRTLPVDNAIEFLSRELSKEASAAR